MAADWQEAARIRRFLDAIEARIDGQPDSSGRAQTWLAWARDRAEQLDPLSESAGNTFEQLVGNKDQKDDLEDEFEDEDELGL